MTTGIVITAAGRGERFIQAGGQGNKLNAGFADAAGERRSLFEHTLRQALASGLPVQVVTRPDNLPVLAACAAKQVPVTLLASSGLGDSIAAGVAATPHWQGWLIHLADMPFVGAEVFRQVADALRQHAIVRPCYAQQPGHPVGFSALLRKPLCQLRGDNGARELLQGAAVHLLPLEHPGVVQDIDLPSQLPASE
ncbi:MULTISPECIES: nucleotidyltransferase family protein [Serratia]|jgi:molybdenum cofactor cytidylyltransferase|uniref:Nucleotidyltransferase family protein n=1 Tax=Serratia marcescens TaxID=615 RepID=A0AAP8PEW9_SERMA|nr:MULTISPECIES: nucleotidyltransferase family protein [Serratia]APS33428.1 molybdopterin-guanine dinucleotide biosynthesis protein MobA [Serratia marcescens]ELI8815648.1 nucleotidyltransferase family protein [Serratia marcescens]ELI8845050.1 nucleotidyltransferase family protein [Serratia marcescens]MBH3191580.1 nucleotidyltransferase family protein [Serratia marcescens]MBI6142173.1 nucleotidyltransferase family protein [Serratia marcescens]